jgi:hypothetical protein
VNRDEALSVLPNADEFHAMPNYGKKDVAERFIRTVLDQLDDESRDPDKWEADHIAAAIGYVLCDWYMVSITATEKSLTPSGKRADSDSWARDADTVTRRALRDALDYAAGKPARNG